MNDLQDIITANNHAFLVGLVKKQAAKLDKIAEVIRDLSFDYDVDAPSVVEVDAIHAVLTGKAAS